MKVGSDNCPAQLIYFTAVEHGDALTTQATQESERGRTVDFLEREACLTADFLEVRHVDC